MIRVLHMIGSLNIGGSQAMIMNLYRNIDREQIQFDFIIDHPEQLDFAEEIKSLGGKIFFLPKFTGINLLSVKKSWNNFFKEHPEYKILHSHVRSYASIYLPIAKKHGLKTIIHSHSTSNGRGITSIVKRILQYPLRFQADYLMSCSSEAGRWLYGDKACLKSNYIFLSNAIDTEQYRYSEGVANKYREELDLVGKFVIGHVGRFHEAKNHMFLLDIFAGICAKRSDVALLLVGDGELRYAIQDKIHSLNLDDRVILTGNRNDVPKLMQAMDVFVFPSKWEGLPVAVVEAQAAGLHCLISDTITKEVDVSVLVKRFPIVSAEVWRDVILGSNFERLDVISDIVDAGFDIKKTSKYLGEFYYSLL